MHESFQKLRKLIRSNAKTTHTGRKKDKTRTIQ